MHAPSVRLVPLPAAALEALVAGDLEEASDLTGVVLPPFFLDEVWLWRIRAEQVRHEPGALDWIVRAVVTPEGVVVGHAGFHGPPDEAGDVEVGYTVVPEHRGRGWGTAALAALLTRADSEPGVKRVVATIAPDNSASLAVVGHFGFVHVGEQVDPVDGRELVYVRPAAQ